MTREKDFDPITLRDSLSALGIDLPEQFPPIDDWANSLSDNPTRNLLAMIGVSTLLFHAAERGRNPKVNDVWDSLVYCTTCLSVGYGDIFARTPVGKILGSTLMTVGPAMAGKALDGSAAKRDAAQQEMLETLKQILAKLGRGEGMTNDK